MKITLSLALLTSFFLAGCGTNPPEGNTDNFLGNPSLPSLHILPVLTDEDGNTNDSKATYTLTAAQNINVSIETPNGSWITPMWRYNANPLPVIIKANRGTNMTLNFNNQLDADSTIHWHGFKIPAAMDGGPDYPVAPGSSMVYRFTMDQPASSLWFHPTSRYADRQSRFIWVLPVSFLLNDGISRELEQSRSAPLRAREISSFWFKIDDLDPENNGIRSAALYESELWMVTVCWVMWCW